MAGDEFRGAARGARILAGTTSEEEREMIERELREHGVQVNLDQPGFSVLKFIGFEMEVSDTVARGRFVVSEKSCQPFGVLHGGITAHIAESIVSIASIAGVYSSKNKRVAGIELNVNHLHAADMGQEVTVIAKALMQGSRIQVWEVKFETEKLKKSTSDTTVNKREVQLIATSRVTLVVGLPLPDSVKDGLKGTWAESKL